MRIAALYAGGFFALTGLAAAYALRPQGSIESSLACAAAARPLARLELVFGTRRKNATPVSEEEWAAFLADEVTPYFPDGLMVFTGYGQWRGADGNIVRETSRMLVIWYPAKDDSGPRIEAIRVAYKARFGQESVLRADGASCVSF
ncbi:MAG: DUF3574 domain-containing protein [Beijerinckiaceae bacterium]|nr:DUF3574 domain-containing protein [Beijerinckiaceae bacterium]MCI0735830.1 DUF3574 domain-containing protein [Beijerinckiaceae bacterium]